MINVYTLFFTAIIAFSGLFIGRMLAKISPEEMKPGKKYFLFFEIFFMILICLFSLIFFKFNWIFLLVGLILGYFLRFIYLYFSGAMFSVNGIAFLCPCLIFIYGLFYGTLYNPIKEWKKTLIQFSLFIVLGIVISLFNLNFGSLCAGGLVTLIYFKIKDYKKNIRR